MHEAISREDKKRKIKSLIVKLHQTPKSHQIREELKKIVCDLQPAEVAQIEEELVKEGMPKEELQEFCDIHLEIFKEALEKEETLAMEGHPVNTLMGEHKILLGFSGELRKIITESLENGADKTQLNSKIEGIVKHFKDSESHYQREENVLFPYLEKKGITQPPAIMWMEHNKIREIKKQIYKILDERTDKDNRVFLQQLLNENNVLSEMLFSHFTKENKILFPTALKVINEQEWAQIREQFDEIGYCCFTPAPAELTVEKEPIKDVGAFPEGTVKFETGSLTPQEISEIFNSLPVDITFVDKDDTVKYFSNSKDRIFLRTKAVIGRKVQQCHPQKSIHLVEKILQEFKRGERKTAEFWINLQSKLIHIRYFPIINPKNEYLGCIEVTQNITEIQKIRGEKRLLE